MLDVLVFESHFQVDAFSKIYNPSWRFLRLCGLLGFVALEGSVCPQDEISLMPFLQYQKKIIIIIMDEQTWGKLSLFM